MGEGRGGGGGKWGNFPLGGVQGSTGPPYVNLGPPKISETTIARMLKLKTQLDIVKYSL